MALALGLVAAWLTAAVPAEARPLAEEFAFILESHPQIKSRRETVSATGERIEERNAAFYPTVALTGDTAYEVVNSPVRRLTAGEAFRGRVDGAALSVTLNVFDGFKKYADLREAEATKSGAEFSLDATLQSVFFQGANIYLQVLRQLRLLELALLSERAIQRQLQLENERVQRGSGLTVDVLQSKSRLQIAKELRVAIEGRLEEALSRYRQVMGRAAEPGAMTVPEPPVAALPQNLDEALETARQENPNLASADRLIDVAEERRRAAQAEYYPSVDLIGAARRDDNVDGILGHRNELSIKVQAKWELFSGFARQARVARAAHQRLARVSDRAFVERRTLDDVRIAWHALATARKRKALLENAVNIASEVFVARRKLRDAGRETVINVLNAENEVNQARIKLTSASFDVLVATYRLHFTVGRLTPEMLGM